MTVCQDVKRLLWKLMLQWSTVLSGPTRDCFICSNIIEENTLTNVQGWKGWNNPGTLFGLGCSQCSWS